MTWRTEQRQQLQRSCSLLACIVIPFSPVLAQDTLSGASPTEVSPLQAEMQLDFRARVPFVGDVATRLHSNQLLLRSVEMGKPRVQFQVWGLNQYGTFTWQQASLQMQVSAGYGSLLPQRLQVGLLRLPFGIYDYRETYATGLIDYPLPRSDYAFNAVDWAGRGIGWQGGLRGLQVEAASVRGSGIGIWGNANGLEGNAVRLQTFAPPGLILGISAWQGRQAAFPRMSYRGTVRLAGIDWRYTRPQLLLRGEALAGVLSDDRTRGAYLDVYYRLPHRDRFTLVTRTEFLKPGSSLPTAQQITLGGRWDLNPEWTLATNWRRNNMDRAYHFTWTTISGTKGEFLFQVLRRFALL